jgi:hypothetical protein
MEHPASDYHRGSQPVDEQASTYHLFMSMTKWGSLYLAALVAWMAIWFCTDAGFLPGLITAVVLVVLGTLALREKPSAGH